MERVLNIQIRLTENTAANNRLLSDLERRVRAAANPSSNSGGTRVASPLLALQVVAAAQSQQKINETRAKLNADLLRWQARAEADETRHQHRMEEIAVQGARRRGAASTGLVNTFLRNASTIREAGESIQAAGGFFSNVGNLLTGLGERSIQASGKVESITRAFTQLDKAAATQTLARLRTQADQLQVSFVSYAEQVNRVRATQKLSTDQSERLVQGLINVGRAVGATRENQDRAVTALNQTLSKGKITSEELRQQLLEAIPNLAPIIEKRFGTLDGEKLEKRFGTRKFASGLIEELGKLQRLDPTPFERFQTSLENLQLKLAPLGAKILDVANQRLPALLEKVEKAIGAFTKLSPRVQQTAIEMGLLAIAAGPVISTLGSIVQLTGAAGNLASVFAKASREAGGLTALLSTGLNPAVLLGTGFVVAAGLAWLKYAEQTELSANIIAGAVAKAKREQEKLGKPITLPDGSKVDVLPDRDLKINVPNLPKIKGPEIGFVEIDPATGKPIGTKNVVKDRFSSLSNTKTNPGDIKNKGGAGVLRDFGRQEISAETEKQTAIAELREATAKRELEQAKVNLNKQTSLLEEALSKREISLTDFYARNDALIQETTRLEVRAIQDQINAERTKFTTIDDEQKKRIEQAAKIEAKELAAAKTLAAKANAQTRHQQQLDIIADQSFVKRTNIEKRLIDLESQREAAQARGDAGAAENLRRRQEALRSFEREIESTRADLLRANGDELGAAIAEIDTRFLDLLSRARAEGGAFLKIVQTFVDKLKEQAKAEDALRQLEKQASGVETSTRIEQERVRALENRGVLRPEQARDVNILLERQERERLLPILQKQLEAKQAQTKLDEIGINRIKEQIAQTQVLGTELTRQEELQRRFAEQGRVDYERLNDRVVDLLASQKGLTEVFQDFRANTVQDGFNLLDTAVDKLAKRFGVLGNSVSQLLKDLARLAAVKIFEKVLNLRPQQAPSGAPGFSIGGLLQPGASGGGGFNLGGFNFPGIGPGGTGTFSGAPVNVGGGTSGGSVGGIRGLINNITGLPIFRGAASAITAPFPSGGGVLPTITAQQAGIPTTLSTETALAKAAGVKAGAGSAFGALGATGLLAGGGLLGSLAGGQSQFGRLLGGLGGTLGAGFIGASGLLGGSAAAGTGIAGSFGALAPLLTNPITAIVAGGLIGGALLVRHFANRDLKKLAETIKDVHQLNVPVKGEGLALLKNVKEIGQQQYGKRWLDQRKDLVQQQTVIDILTQYAVGTGQNSSPLVRNKRLADPFNDANNFVRRLNGGPIPGPTLGRDYIAALLDGNEYVSAARTVQREGVGKFAALDAGAATITPKGATAEVMNEMAALRAEFRAGISAMVAVQNQIVRNTSKLGLATFGQVVVGGLAEEPSALDDALDHAMRTGNLYNFTDQLRNQ